MNLPNAITLLRLVLVPVFLALYLRGAVVAALVVFSLAALSDVVDGLLARLLRRQTRWGAIFDPVADKLLGFAALVLLTWSGKLPPLLLGLSVARDVTVFAVGMGAKLLGRPIEAAPTRVSKYATLGVMLTIVLTLGMELPHLSELAPYQAAVGLLAAECLVIATAQYLWRGGKLLRAPVEVG